MADTDTTSDTVMKVEYLQDKLNGKPPPDDHMMMKILKKLCQLPITMSILQETGLGRDINGLRKKEGKIGSMARGLVQSWKDMVRTTNKEHKAAPAAKKTSPESSSKVQSGTPKIPRIPKIKKEKVDDVESRSSTPHADKTQPIKKEKTNTLKPHKNTTESKHITAADEGKKKIIASQSPAKRKDSDKYKVLSSRDIKVEGDRTDTVSPNRGLQVETVYAGSSNIADQDRGYNDFMQKTRTIDSGSDADSSQQGDSNLEQKTGSLKKRSHNETGHSGPDLEDPEITNGLDRQKKRKISDSPDSKKTSPDSKTSSPHKKTSPDTYMSPLKNAASPATARAYSSDSEASYYESDNGAPPESSSPEESAHENEQKSSSSSALSSASSYDYSDSADSLLANPLDKVLNIKQEGQSKSEHEEKLRKKKRAKEMKRAKHERRKRREQHEKAIEERKKEREMRIAEKKLKEQKHKFDESMSRLSSDSEGDTRYARKVRHDISDSDQDSQYKKTNKKSKRNKHSSKHHRALSLIKLGGDPSSRHDRREKDHHRTKHGASLSKEDKSKRVTSKSKPVAIKVEQFDEWDDGPSVDSFSLPGQFVPDDDIYDSHDYHSPHPVHDPLNLEGNTYIKTEDPVSVETPPTVEDKVPDSPAKPVKKKKKKRVVDVSEKTFENTGMSFADCMGALQMPVPKKKKKKPAVPVVQNNAQKPTAGITNNKEKLSETKTASKPKSSKDMDLLSSSENKSSRHLSSKADGGSRYSSNEDATSSSWKTKMSSSSDSPEKFKKSNDHSGHREGGSSRESSKSHGSSSKEHHRSEKSSHDNLKEVKSHRDKSLHNGEKDRSSSRDKHSKDVIKNGSHRDKSSHDKSKVNSHRDGGSHDRSNDRTKASAHRDRSSHDGSKVNSHKDGSSHDRSNDRTKASAHKDRSSHDGSKVNSHKDKTSQNGEKVHHSHRDNNSHDRNKVSSHKEKSRSESGRSSSDRTPKDKDHHRSHKTHSSSHEKKHSDRHKKTSEKVKNSPDKSRQESREERKRKWSSSADESLLNSPKVRKNPAEFSLNLPDIQPDYRPVHMPIIEPRKKIANTLDDPMIGLSRHSRTKVYSGKKRSTLTEVPRLFDMCMTILCDNIDALDEVGGVPADILKPVLDRCTPQQLFRLEDYNPHFLVDTDELWQKHGVRDFRNSKPDEFESWREFYIRRYDERDAKLKALRVNIKANQAAKDPTRTTKMAYMDRQPKPPRSVKRAQAIHGTHTGEHTPRAPCSAASRKPKTDDRDTSSSRRDYSDGGALARSSRAQPRGARVVAPMMQKSMKMFKKAQTRR